MLSNNGVELMMSFKSQAALKIACLLLNTPDGRLPATPGILVRLVKCSYKSVRTGLQEIGASELVTIERTGDILTISLNRLSLKDTDLSPPDTNLSLRDKNVNLSADKEEEEDYISSSSSLLKSAPKSQNLSNGDKNGYLPDKITCSGDTAAEMIAYTLDELGMRRKFVLQKVLSAAQKLPLEKVREALEKCLLYNAQTPAYVVKVLHQARSELAKEADACRMSIAR